MGTRQNKKKILIDTSASKTSSNGNGLKSLSGLNLINKNELTSKIQPVDSGENQSPKLLSSSINKIKPKLLHSNQQKPATVSKTFSSNSSSSTELQPLASILTTAAGANNSEASRKVVNSTSKISNGKKTEIKKITVSVPKKQETTPTLNKQKKKKTWNEKKSLNRLNDINKNNNQKNSNFGFVLPEETLSIENYYKSCNLTYKNGVYLDPNGVENEFLMGCLIFDENKNFADGPLQPDKVLPDIYLSVLNAARANKKILSSKLLKCLPNNFEILSKLRKKIVTPEDAGKKFEVFTYLQLIEEFLESDEPLAKGATITCEAKQSEEVEQQKNRLQNSEKNEEKKVNKSVLYVSIPFEKDSHVEENIKFMGILYLIPDNDVKNNVSTIILEVKVAKILPSVKKGPTNLITVIGKKELKQLRDLGENIKKTFSIFVVPYVMATNAILKSVKAITSKTDLASKVFPPYKNNANDILKFRKQMFSGLDSLFYSSTKSFNQKQKEAIYSMTRPVNTTFILFGPPGTGKTYTLVETIRQLLNPSSKKTSTTDRTILVCTPSNMAADAIAEGIIDGNFLQTGEIFRLVSVSRDTFKRNLKLDCITQRQVLTDNREQTICTIYDLPNTALLKEYKIIICTLGSIPKLCLFLEPGHFSHIFVDEAAQAPEMDVWLAVGHLATRDTRIILAGDPKQLGPVTTVNLLSTNENYGYKKSLLARLVDKNVFNNDPRYLIQLTENHRSHEGIVKISSELFYENTLIATKPIGHDSLCRLPFLQKNNFPILFHSVNSGKEETSVETRSKRNLAEVSVIVEYVKKCLHQNVAAEDIGVVSPYTYQAESIRKSLNNKDITVDTVEKYQGSERRVIIISCVRTCGKLGFMADNLRFNTAITRAKHLLIVVGHVDSMSTQKSWKRFIDYCGQNGSLVKDFQKNHESIQHSLARLRI
uniref:RNA helicase n=1 Tax=Panagrolaimus superbus TaxID=310955 RepID=A0A914Y7Q6_9BILA